MTQLLVLLSEVKQDGYQQNRKEQCRMKERKVILAIKGKITYILEVKGKKLETVIRYFDKYKNENNKYFISNLKLVYQNRTIKCDWTMNIVYVLPHFPILILS